MKTSEELSCAELVELVTDYLEGALSAADRERFEEHLGDCDGCSIYLDQMRRTIELTGRLSEADLDPQTKAALLATFREWKRR
jgi:anti-sigma factor RsiW